MTRTSRVSLSAILVLPYLGQTDVPRTVAPRYGTDPYKRKFREKGGAIVEKQWVHLCIDMQRMFAEDTPWHVAWMRRVSPEIEELAGRHPTRTIFTRFLPPARADYMAGTW